MPGRACLGCGGCVSRCSGRRESAYESSDMKSVLALFAACILATPVLAAGKDAAENAVAFQTLGITQRRRGEHRRQAHRISRGRRHAGRPSQGLGRHRRSRQRRRQKGQSDGRGLDVLRGLFQARRRRRRTGRSPSCSMAAPAPRACGCTWAPSGRSGSSPTTTRHTPAAPYQVVNNDQSLLDASRPGLHRRARHRLQPHRRQGQGQGVLRRRSGHPRLRGLHPRVPVQIRPLELAQIRLRRELRHHARRRAGLALQKENIDLNGVMLLSCILNWDMMPDDPELNPSIDEPYIVALPTYAATAWYHHKLPNQPKELRPLAGRGRAFRHHRLRAGADQGQQPRPRRRARPSPTKLHAFTGLPVAYLLKANLRIEYGAFQKEILRRPGRDHRHAGHALRRPDDGSAEQGRPNTIRKARPSPRPMSRP